MSFSLSTHQKERLLFLLQEMVQKDEILRETHKIGNKFQFIHDQLQVLLARFQSYLESSTDTASSALMLSEALAADETLVYIHLFNARGVDKQTWKKMISKSLLYEYSINRPIYNEKKLIEAFIKSKPNSAHHAYLTIAVKKEAILSPEKTLVKDTLGNVTIKVKEGAFQFDRIISFHHQDQDYLMNTNGEFNINLSL